MNPEHIKKKIQAMAAPTQEWEDGHTVAVPKEVCDLACHLVDELLRNKIPPKDIRAYRGVAIPNSVHVECPVDRREFEFIVSPDGQIRYSETTDEETVSDGSFYFRPDIIASILLGE